MGKLFAFDPCAFVKTIEVKMAAVAVKSIKGQQ